MTGKEKDGTPAKDKVIRINQIRKLAVGGGI